MFQVRQASPSSLYVIIQKSTGVTVTADLVGDGPDSWAWRIVCNLCGETKRVDKSEWLMRASAEAAMLHHAAAHERHDSDGGPDRGFGGYGWTAE